MMMCSMTSAILFYEPFDSKLNLNETIELDTNLFDADWNKLMTWYNSYCMTHTVWVIQYVILHGETWYIHQKRLFLQKYHPWMMPSVSKSLNQSLTHPWWINDDSINQKSTEKWKSDCMADESWSLCDRFVLYLTVWIRHLIHIQGCTHC